MLRRKWLAQHQSMFKPSTLRACVEKNIIIGDPGPSLQDQRGARFARQDESIRLSSIPTHQQAVRGGFNARLPPNLVICDEPAPAAARHRQHRHYEPKMPLPALPQSVRYLSNGRSQHRIDLEKFKVECLRDSLRSANRPTMAAPTIRHISAADLLHFGVVHHQTQPL